MIVFKRNQKESSIYSVRRVAILGGKTVISKGKERNFSTSNVQFLDLGAD